MDMVEQRRHAYITFLQLEVVKLHVRGSAFIPIHSI